MRRSSVAAGAGLPTRRGTASKLCGWRKVGDAGPIPALEQAVRIAVRRRPVALRRRTRCPSRANEARQTDPLWIRRRWAETRRDLVLRLWRAVRSTIRPASVRHRTSWPSSGTAPRPAARLDPQHRVPDRVFHHAPGRAERTGDDIAEPVQGQRHPACPAEKQQYLAWRPGARAEHEPEWHDRAQELGNSRGGRTMWSRFSHPTSGHGLGLSVSSSLFCPFYPRSASWHKPEAQPPRSLLEDEPAACDPVCAHDGVPEAT
jgi:hypothetical protein